MSPYLVAAILSAEFGIGVRGGCFCAQPYAMHLLGISTGQAGRMRRDILAGDRTGSPGMVRASFGAYNTLDEVDALLEAVARIALGDYRGEYHLDPVSGHFEAAGWSPDLNRYFQL